MTEESKFFLCISGIFAFIAGIFHSIYSHICKSLAFLVCSTECSTADDEKCCDDSNRETDFENVEEDSIENDSIEDGEVLRKRANKGYFYKIARNVAIVFSVITFIMGALLIINELWED